MTQVQDAVIRNIPLKTNQRDRLEIKLVLTGRYMSLALRTARIFWLKRTAKWSAAQAASAPPVVPYLFKNARHTDHSLPELVTSGSRWPHIWENLPFYRIIQSL